MEGGAEGRGVELNDGHENLEAGLEEGTYLDNKKYL